MGKHRFHISLKGGSEEDKRKRLNEQCRHWHHNNKEKCNKICNAVQKRHHYKYQYNYNKKTNYAAQKKYQSSKQGKLMAKERYLMKVGDKKGHKIIDEFLMKSLKKSLNTNPVQKVVKNKI